MLQSVSKHEGLFGFKGLPIPVIDTIANNHRSDSGDKA